MCILRSKFSFNPIRNELVTSQNLEKSLYLQNVDSSINYPTSFSQIITFYIPLPLGVIVLFAYCFLFLPGYVTGIFSLLFIEGTKELIVSVVFESANGQTFRDLLVHNSILKFLLFILLCALLLHVHFNNVSVVATGYFKHQQPFLK